MVSLRTHLARILAAIIVSAAGGLNASDGNPHDALLDRWFGVQSSLKTWSADLVQIRTLKALKEPLRTPGKVWFASPNQFRWELGVPAQTIALREPDALMVIYPRLKRAEKYPLNDDSTGQWRDALTLLESGFPQSRSELEKQFEILDVTVDGPVAELRLQPRSVSTRKMLKEVRIGFSTEDFLLRATELVFADDSSLRNEFENGVKNPPLPPDRFEADIPAGFKVSEPLSKLGR